jgi:hypothetical protein
MIEPRTNAERHTAFDAMKLRKRAYHARLFRRIDEIARAAGRAIPNPDDTDKAQRQMWPEYIATCRF